MEQLEDLDLWLRMGERGRLANLDRVVTRYRIHEDAKSEALPGGPGAGDAVRASDEACDRRGIPRRQISPAALAADGAGLETSVTRSIFGWSGFRRGDRSMALHYGLRAVRPGPLAARRLEAPGLRLLKKPAGGAT